MSDSHVIACADWRRRPEEVLMNKTLMVGLWFSIKETCVFLIECQDYLNYMRFIKMTDRLILKIGIEITTIISQEADKECAPQFQSPMF